MHEKVGQMYDRQMALDFDNCPSDPKDINQKLKMLQFFYFPPNTTSKLQRMDQEVIKRFKVHYRNRITRKVIIALEDNKFMPKIDFPENISEIQSKILPNLDYLPVIKIGKYRRRR